MATVACHHCTRPIVVARYRTLRSKRFWCSKDCKSREMCKPPDWNPEPTVAAYIAGILDGEGSVFIAERRQKGSRFRYAFLVATIVNTDMTLLAYIKRSVGNGVRFTEVVRPRTLLSRLPVMHLWFTHHRAIAFLEPLLPYLIIKKDKARLGIEFQRLPLAERLLDAQGQVYRARINHTHQAISS
jgi:hypothetical protein